MDISLDKWPKVQLDIEIILTSGDAEGKDRPKAERRRGMTWYNLSILFLRSDGEFVDYRHMKCVIPFQSLSGHASSSAALTTSVLLMLLLDRSLLTGP